MSDRSFHHDERLRKAERLLERSRFKEVERHGRRCSSKYLVVYAYGNELDWARIGLTLTRKVGNAATRNRWKRRLREIFRRNKSKIPRGYDYVVIVRRRAGRREPEFFDLRDELIELMNEATQP